MAALLRMVVLRNGGDRNGYILNFYSEERCDLRRQQKMDGYGAAVTCDGRRLAATAKSNTVSGHDNVSCGGIVKSLYVKHLQERRAEKMFTMMHSLI